MQFSVLLSVYEKENPEHFALAIESVLNQTVKPDEIVLVRDGVVPVTLQKSIDQFIETYSDVFTYIPLDKNVGLGEALRCGVEKAKHEWIFRMDTDDISVPDRFEKQIAYIKEHPEVDVLGGQIEEFIGDPQNVVSKRSVPLGHDGIVDFMKVRNPMSHVSVAIKKESLLLVGNYMHAHYVEDYFLWCRMFLQGCTFANLPDTLVLVRVGKDMYRRRGGYRYFCSLRDLEKFKLKNKMISKVRYFKTLAARFILQVLCPTTIRGYLFKKIARD